MYNCMLTHRRLCISCYRGKRNVTRHCVQGNRYRGRNAAVNAPSRNASADQRAKLGADRKRSTSVGASLRETRSLRDENSVKCRAMRSQGPHEWLLPLRKENNTEREMLGMCKL